ncbi:MAG: hypothetical protein ACOX2F_10620 [bacterium]
MKFNKRIVPFTTLILSNTENFDLLSKQIEKWCRSDSFNPKGTAYMIDSESGTGAKFNCFGTKKIEQGEENTLSSLCKFIRALKPSITIDFSNTKKSRTLSFFSRSGRTVGLRGLYSFFFLSSSYSKFYLNDLEKAAPYLFNDLENDRFLYRITSKIVDCEKPNKAKEEEIPQKDEELIIDLGEIPENPTGRILWVPKRTTIEGVWKDFIKITYFSQEENCLIDVHFKNEGIQKKFETMFFIKGRKMDLDKYLNIISEDTLEKTVFSDKGEVNYKFVVFSFGLSTEYRSLYLKMKKTGENSKLTTVTKIKKVLI